MKPFIAFLLLLNTGFLYAQPHWKPADFRLPLHENFGNPNQLFVSSGYTTVAPRFGSVTGVSGFFSPPLAASDFDLKMQFNVNGVRIVDTGAPGGGHEGLLYSGGYWQPDRLVRRGTYHRYVGENLLSLAVTSELVPLFGREGFILKVSILNRNEVPLTVNLEPIVTPGRPGNISLDQWGFSIAKGNLDAVAKGLGQWSNGSATIQLSKKDSVLVIAPHQTGTTYVAITIGANTALPVIDFAQQEQNTANVWQERLSRYGDQVPHLKSDIPGLEAYYNRALISGLVCLWEKPGFIIRPYIATSGMDGGAMNAYLWDVAGYAPNTMAQLFGGYLDTLARQLASIKLDQFYSLTPAGTGIGVSYAYSTHAFTSLVWSMARHGILTPDLYAETKRLILNVEARPQQNHLIDFGNQHNLLEMRTTGWEHIVASPNAERALSLERLANLADLLKADQAQTKQWRQKAEQIREAIRTQLWDEKIGWFRCIYPNGHTEMVYSVQAFDVLRTGACTPLMAAMLYKHLIPGKFLFDYGISSISAEDTVHYEYNDTDWGGSGAYSGDAPELALTLYEQKRPDLALDVLKREFWMGNHLPYFPQEHYADKPGVPAHKRSNIVSGLTGTEVILYGMAGLDPQADGSLWIDPQVPALNSLRVNGYRLHGHLIDVTIEKRNCKINVDGKMTYQGPVKRFRILPPAR